MSEFSKSAIYIPVTMATNIVKDADGRCWELQGFQEQTEILPIEDLDTYDLIDQKECCEECKNNDLFEDVVLPVVLDSESSTSSNSSSSFFSSSSSSSELYDYYEYEISYDCGSECCASHTIGWGFTVEECWLDLTENKLSFIETVCQQDCGEEMSDTGPGWFLCDPEFWARYAIDIPGVWSCGFCCQPESSSSSSESSSSESSSESSQSLNDSSSSSESSESSESSSESSQSSESSESSSSDSSSSSSESSGSSSSSSAYDIDAFTVLLLHGDGVDASTSFPDSSPSAHTVTAQGDAQVNTSVVKFGTGSIKLDGSGDYLTVPDHADFDFGTGEFTIDLWVYLLSKPASFYFLNQYQDALNYFHFYFENNGNGLLFNINGSIITQGNSASWNVDQWYHIAAVRSGTTVTLYRNGISVASGVLATAISFNAILDIGSAGGLAGIHGYIDEYRISNVARWTSNFTPPSYPYG